MKKVILLTGVIIMMYAASALAETAATTTIASGFVSGFNLSKNVHAAYASSAAPSGYYAMATKHDAGDLIFGGISNDTTMYKKPGTAATTITTGGLPTTTPSGTATVTGWTSM